MMNVEDIEKAVSELPAAELDRFRAWFKSFDAEPFDAKLERDARSGKLDRLAEEALAEHPPAAPANYEAFCEPDLLATLSSFATECSAAR